ncbi:outer membrane cobalamin receptor [Sphingobium sp. OAS761]|uniref:TonB-dependent receptor plug domain-containing protein n=1 Tax=Sphingobium sp. OAS761 TaxID=2817901 RepID=UPI00209DAF0F|nr:outer membrane cobalamin receptor [Sphingobium sp. OAS761]
MRNHLHHLCAVSIIAITPGIAIAQVGGHGQRDIVVTAAPLGQKADETATPVVTLTGEELIHRRAATLGETLAGQPGINFENFGGGAGRPIIRGQSSPRV